MYICVCVCTYIIHTRVPRGRLLFAAAFAWSMTEKWLLVCTYIKVTIYKCLATPRHPNMRFARELGPEMLLYTYIMYIYNTTGEEKKL